MRSKEEVEKVLEKRAVVLVLVTTLRLPRGLPCGVLCCLSGNNSLSLEEVVEVKCLADRSLDSGSDLQHECVTLDCPK